MNEKGIRVVSFDLPSHGKTQGNHWDDLDWWSFDDLSRLVEVIDHETVEDQSRPLIIAGWSTGGLLAIRMEQMRH